MGGRRWNVDPILKFEESPYLTFGGNPILKSDVDGDDAKGVGDPPVTAYHNTTVNNGAKIAIDGTFKAGKSGWNYFMSSPLGSKAGADVAKAPVQFKVEINITGAKEISYKQWNSFYNEAKSELGLSEVAGRDLNNGQIKQLNAIRNQKAVAYMNSVEADAFIIHAEKGSSGQKFYALKDNSALTRVSDNFITTRGGNEMASTIIKQSYKFRAATIGKAILRTLKDGVIIEGVIFAMEQKHLANKEYAKRNSWGGMHDVGLYYYLTPKSEPSKPAKKSGFLSNWDGYGN